MKIKEILVILLCSFTFIGFGQTKLDKIEKKYVDIIKLSEKWINENFNFRSGKYNGINTTVQIYKDENIDIVVIDLETTGNSRDRIECLINKKNMTYIIQPGLYGISHLLSTMDKKKYFIEVINQKEGYYSVGLFDILNKRLVIQPKFNDFSATSENRIYKENAQMMNISKTTVITYKDKENNEYTYNLTNNKITKIPINLVVNDARDGKSYKLELFNNKRWFIEDLKYEGKEYTKSNYSKYKETGLFYKNNNIYRNELCPKGFKIPSKEDFDALPDSYFINYTEFKGCINFDGSGFGEDRKRQSVPSNNSKAAVYLTSGTTDSYDGKVMYNNCYIFEYFTHDNSYRRTYDQLTSYIRYIPCRCIEE